MQYDGSTPQDDGYFSIQNSQDHPNQRDIDQIKSQGDQRAEFIASYGIESLPAVIDPINFWFSDQNVGVICEYRQCKEYYQTSRQIRSDKNACDQAQNCLMDIFWFRIFVCFHVGSVG